MNGRGYQNWLTLHNSFLMVQLDLMLTKEVSKVIHTKKASTFTKSVHNSILYFDIKISTIVRRGVEVAIAPLYCIGTLCLSCRFVLYKNLVYFVYITWYL